MIDWDDMIDSIKTYGLAMFGWMVSIMNWTCVFVEKLTVLLIFASVLVRLAHDYPRAVESIRKYLKKRRADAKGNQ